MLSVDDTALAVTDTGGTGIPVRYFNGNTATQGYWRHVIAELGTGWRHITYDMRGRGKSKRSADHSFETKVTPRVSAAQIAESSIETSRIARERVLAPGWTRSSPGAVCGHVGGAPRKQG
ncbi:alpha/beta fold hydrolase [Nonomuraea sp. NPDC052265]|uniref:alpha/beta fold hydrolase n=1 Tax=Nonomuraea sp. NPDC052265 TaxID=3364374 RepID=UPI0037C7A8A9